MKREKKTDLFRMEELLSVPLPTKQSKKLLNKLDRNLSKNRTEQQLSKFRE